MHDWKLAFRNIRNRPAFGLTIVGLLALGIAGNAAVFSIFNGLFLRPLPFADSDRLIELDETAPKWSLKYVGVAVPDAFAWRTANSTFEGTAFFTAVSFNFADRGSSQRINGAQVTREMLDLLRLKPIIGRDFLPAEDSPGGANVALLRHEFWQRMFQSDPQVAGHVIQLDGQSYTVIGVLPPAAVFPDGADLWTPLAADPNRPSGYYLNGIGRLKPGVSVEQAQSDLTRIHKAMIGSRPSNAITSPILTALRDRYLGGYKTVSRVLLIAVALVLLIACVNIAALMMVRAAARAREMAIRSAIGAGRGRIAQQLMTESLVLAALGGVIGVPLGVVSLNALVARMPQDMPQWIRFSPDWTFAAFCVAITGASAVLSGLAPMLQLSRTDIRGALQDAALRTTVSRGRRSVLRALVACEIALALILTAGAGLLVEAFRNVMQVDPGFRPRNVLTFRLSLPDTGYDRPEQKIAYYDALLARLRNLPGVEAAGATSAPPFGGHWGGQFEGEGATVVHQPNENPVVQRVAATPGYFDAIGMTLLDGRAFDANDARPESPQVAVVNQTLARHFWGDQPPVGKRIRYPGAKDWYQVVGLVKDEKHDGLDQDAQPTVFLPYSKAILKSDPNDLRSLRLMSIILRGISDPTALLGPVREVVRQLDAGVPMYDVQTMTAQMDRSLWTRRAYSWLFGAFAVVALLLAAGGVYGTVSYVVGERTQEIAIRVALGARPVQVLRMVLTGGMGAVSLGIVAGLLGALWASRLLHALLFHVSLTDPLIYGAAVIAMIAVGLVANLVPARRAAATDPMRSLR